MCEVEERMTELELFELPCVGDLINRLATQHAIRVGKETLAAINDRPLPYTSADEEADEAEMFAYYGELTRLNDLVLAEARKMGILTEEKQEEPVDEAQVVDVDCSDCDPSVGKCSSCHKEES